MQMVATGQIHFFATANDLREVQVEFESSVGSGVRYTPIGVTDEFPTRSYRSLADLPSLGAASRPTAIAGSAYLITASDAEVKPVSITQSNGTRRYAIDQRSCDDSIVLMPGGMYGLDVMLYGKVGTVSNTETAAILYRHFSRAVRKHWHKVKSYWVGREAEAHWRSGVRLTIGLESPSEFDLA
jgi:hypothetical protein